MKKIYMSPAMDVIELKKQTLLAGSTPGLGGELGGSDPILAPEFDDDLPSAGGLLPFEGSNLIFE